MKTLMVSMAGLIMMACSVYADGLEFGILAKSIDDANFVDTARGCQEAAGLSGDRCVLIGGHGPALARSQVRALKSAVKTGQYSAFAISVIFSDVLAGAVRDYVTVPVMTFDSPFAPPDDFLSMAYVGTDNVAFGHDLAGIVKAFRPQGGSVFFMGDLHDTNLAQRIWGLRTELSGRPSFPMDQRLNGEGQWFESPRSPWNSGDTHERAIDQVLIMMEQVRPDVFVSVGHWPVIDPEAYRKAMFPYYEDIVSRKILMVFGVGKITPELRDLVDEGLIHGLVSINFNEIGRKTYEIMRDMADGRPVPEKTYIPNTMITVKQD